jgi:uncharacterized membrane protein YgaE (UPF0421/DUF939 family)
MTIIFFISVFVGIVVAIITEFLVYKQESKMKDVRIEHNEELNLTLKAFAQKKNEANIRSQDIKLRDYWIKFNQSYASPTSINSYLRTDISINKRYLPKYNLSSYRNEELVAI